MAKINIGSDRNKTEKFIKKIEEAKRGKIPFTLILIDPVGNSAIISDEIEENN